MNSRRGPPLPPPLAGQAHDEVADLEPFEPPMDVVLTDPRRPATGGQQLRAHGGGDVRLPAGESLDREQVEQVSEGALLVDRRSAALSTPSETGSRV